MLRIPQKKTVRHGISDVGILPTLAAKLNSEGANTGNSD